MPTDTTPAQAGQQDYPVVADFDSEVWQRVADFDDAAVFLAGVRFAEKFHRIGGEA